MPSALLSALALAGLVAANTAIAETQDSDGDGIADVDEDQNRNGVVDPGETDPHDLDTDHDNVPDDLEQAMGTSPTDATDLPPVPEPLFFDLIRNLGSRRGEIEVNVLASSRLRGEGLRWSPEIEYVPIAGLGLELEIPFAGGEIESVKAGVLGTLASFAARRLEIGAMGLFERSVHDTSFDAMMGLVTAVRFTPRIHGITVVGPVVRGRGRASLGGTLNPSLFYQAKRELTFGLELGYGVDPEERPDTTGSRSTIRAIPQVHLNPLPSIKVQVGAGAELAGSLLSPLLALRLCWEH